MVEITTREVGTDMEFVIIGSEPEVQAETDRLRQQYPIDPYLTWPKQFARIDNQTCQAVVAIWNI
jgi:hypothetical protein